MTNLVSVITQEVLDLHEQWTMDHSTGTRLVSDVGKIEIQVDLRRANLRQADLSGTDLSGADLIETDLRGADLQKANLSGADLRGADLGGADLRGSNLIEADLSGAKNSELAEALTSILPSGDIIGWKKLRNERIAKLLIPAEAKRSNATGRKCRAEYAKVLEIWEGETAVETGDSKYDNNFVYLVGETVRPELPFNENRWSECASGIHFFITRFEAEKCE